jgi:DNA-binding transcriptional regulator YiaG
MRPTPTAATIDLAFARRMAASGEARVLRVRAGLRQGDVWRMVGAVTRTTVSHWEKGDRLPTGKAGVRYGQLLRALAGEFGE